MTDGRANNGGRRPGAGSKPKPPLDATEWLIADSTRGLAAKSRLVSQHRIAGAKDPRTIRARSVSRDWIRQQIKLRVESMKARNESLPNIDTSTDHSVSRMGLPNPSEVVARVQNQENEATAKGVEETKGGEA